MKFTALERAAQKAIAEGRAWWRCTDQYGRSCNGGDRLFRLTPATAKKPGPWAPTIDDVKICKRGYHVTSDPLRWAGCMVELVEIDLVAEKENDKVVCHTMRHLFTVDPVFCFDIRVLIAASRNFLRHAYLSGANLSGANLSYANLSGSINPDGTKHP